MSKIRKRSGKDSGAAELFSDDEFDTDDFVELMDEQDQRHRVETRSSARRIEELREERMLREALLDYDDWGSQD